MLFVCNEKETILTKDRHGESVEEVSNKVIEIVLAVFNDKLNT